MSEQLVTRTASIHLDGDPAEVLPLFTAIGEYKWIPGRNPELIYPAAGEPMTNNVFATQHGSGAKTTWVTVDYNPAAQHVEYVNVTPGLTSLRIEIQCSAAAGGGTTAEVGHTLIAITEAGYAEVAKFTEAAFAERMNQWQTAINYYLAHHALIPAH